MKAMEVEWEDGRRDRWEGGREMGFEGVRGVRIWLYCYHGEKEIEFTKEHMDGKGVLRCEWVNGEWEISKISR